MLVIGGRDVEAGNVSVRLHGKGNVGAKPKGEVVADILAAIKEWRASDSSDIQTLHQPKPTMKIFLYSTVFAILGFNLMAQPPETKSSAPAKLTSTIFDWEKMQPVPTTNGVRRTLFDAPTATLDKLNCHITTLNPGQVSGAPRRHLQEEVIIVKEGTIEATYDGHSQTVGPGSVIFFASQATKCLRNPGKVPATYTVIYYYTPLTPKS